MAIDASYVFIVSMDVEPEKEDLFNEVYEEHVDYLKEVPGLRSVTRMKGEPFGMAIAGEVLQKPAPSPVYTAIYEIDDPSVIAGDAWAEAVEKGRWGPEVRPFTHNRTHGLFRKI